MRSRDASSWMWGEALRLLDRADRLHRQFFVHDARAWEPPVDIIESRGEVRLQVALPGVPLDAIAIATEADGIAISALRSFPCREEGAQIHRVEIPYGRFGRRIGLPFDELRLTGKELKDGILTLTFRRKESA